MWLIIWCIDGNGFKHDMPGHIASLDGNVLHVRETDTFKVVASYSLYNVIRWGLTNEQ